jgi:hypothetical protein
MTSTTGAHDQIESPGGGAWFDRWATQYDPERRLLISPFDAYYEAAAEAASILPDRKSTRLNSSHNPASRMPSSA